MDASDLANHLMDVEHAGAQRCEASATLLAPGPLQALLLLQAAEHREAAAALNDAVVRLRGAPQSGEADVVLRDPAGPGFPAKTAAADTLLASCIAEAEGAVQTYHQALRAEALPEWLQRLLAGRLAVAQQQLEQLMDARSSMVEATRS
jgi:type II secretory pathway component PulM